MVLFSGDALQKKWKSIRGCFTREVNRQKAIKSGSGGGRKSEYVFFQQLKFLKNVSLVREPGSVTAEEPAELASSKEDNEVVKKSKKRKTNQITEIADDKLVEAINKSIENREKYDTLNQDEDRLFMLSLVSTLKRVPPQRKMATKIKIMSVLDEATRTEHYNNIETPGPLNYHPG